MLSHMGKLINAHEAAKVAGISRSQINRDAKAGTLPTAIQFPGYNGPRLFDLRDVRATYQVHDAAAAS